MIPPELELGQIKGDLRRMEMEYRRFLARDLPTPPVELQKQIKRRIDRLRINPKLSYANRFLLQSLESNFNSLRDLYFRKTRDAEEGGRSGPVSVPERPRFNVSDGVTLGGKPTSGAVDALFGGLQERKSGSKFNRTTFEGYLVKQIDMIQKKTGCEKVQFRLVDDGGKVKLKARPVY